MKALHLILAATCPNNEAISELVTVESAFQASKVFEGGGPFYDILEMTSREAKKDERIKTSGRLIKFKFFSTEFDIIAHRIFYTIGIF